MSNEVLHVTDATFEEEVLKSDVPVVVDFWAPWCAPCHVIAPILEELAADYDGRAVLAKLDVDQNMDTAGRYGIMSIPTMIIFKNGEEVERMVGTRPKKAIAERLDLAMESED